MGSDVGTGTLIGDKKRLNLIVGGLTSRSSEREDVQIKSTTLV